MKNTLTTIMLVLAFGVVAHAQYCDMQRSLNINGESNPIRPEINNDLSHLGAAYTLGTEAGNLTGEYGRHMQFRLYTTNPNSGDVWLRMTLFNADGSIREDSNERLSLGGIVIPGNNLFHMILTGDKLFYRNVSPNPGNFQDTKDMSVFDMLGGYIDYVAISGAGGSVAISNFQFGNGWFVDENNYGFMDMAPIRGYALNAGFTGEPSFSNGNFTFGSGNTSVTFTSKAVAWNVETGMGISGSFVTGGPMGLQGWNNLTFTFGSFERHPVPEPATLVILGIAVAGLPVVRRLRKK